MLLHTCSSLTSDVPCPAIPKRSSQQTHYACIACATQFQQESTLPLLPSVAWTYTQLLWAFPASPKSMSLTVFAWCNLRTYFCIRNTVAKGWDKQSPEQYRSQLVAIEQPQLIQLSQLSQLIQLPHSRVMCSHHFPAAANQSCHR